VKGRSLKTLRENAGLTQDEVARSLGVATRTLSKYERSEEILPRPYLLVLRELFEPRLVVPRVQEIAERLFAAVPSEMVSLWLVREATSVALLQQTSRFQCLLGRDEERSECPWRRGDCDDRMPCWRSDTVVKSLEEVSMVTYPLRGGETLNLSGEAITCHEAKLMPGRGNHFMRCGEVHSLLHVPLHTPTDAGPRPVALAVLENRLEPVLDGQWRVLGCQWPGAHGGGGLSGQAGADDSPGYSTEDEARVRDIVKHEVAGEFADLLSGLYG
jgi:transcriptional regulator with XRE-family HTH domain